MYPSSPYTAPSHRTREDTCKYAVRFWFIHTNTHPHIHMHERTHIHTHTLIPVSPPAISVSDLWVEDETVYVCEAQNQFGRIQTHARVTVTGLGKRQTEIRVL